MPKSYWTKIQTPDGLKYFRADDATDELMHKIKDAANAFYATYIYNGPDSGNTSYEDIKEAYDAGRAIYVKYKENASDIGTELFALVSFTDYTGTSTPTTFNHFRFQTLEQSTGKTIYRFPGNWGKLSDHTFADLASLRSLKMAIAKDFALLDFPVAEGTYCTYDYDLYKANQEVATDTWSDSQWTKVDVMSELTSLISEAGGLFIARYQETTPTELFAAIDSGKTVYVSLSSQGIGPFLQASVISKDAQLSTTYARFTGTYEQHQYDGVIREYATECNPAGWGPVTEIPLAVQSNVAPEYDSLQTYAVGDIAYRNSLLYRCTTAIDTPENWTPAHWAQTTVADEFKRTSNIDTWTEVQISSVTAAVTDFHWCKMYYNDTLKMYSLNFWCTIFDVSHLSPGWNNLFEVDMQDAPNILNFACRSRRENAVWVSENIVEQIGFIKTAGKVYLRLVNSDTASHGERLYYAPTIMFPATYFSGI